jgi:hypothetical protein
VRSFFEITTDSWYVPAQMMIVEPGEARATPPLIVAASGFWQSEPSSTTIGGPAASADGANGISAIASARMIPGVRFMVSPFPPELGARTHERRFARQSEPSAPGIAANVTFISWLYRCVKAFADGLGEATCWRL